MQYGSNRNSTDKEGRQWLNKEHTSPETEYWIKATLAEAYIGIGDEAQGQKFLETAFLTAAADWMKDSTTEQIKKLRAMLADSPLKQCNAPH